MSELERRLQALSPARRALLESRMRRDAGTPKRVPGIPLRDADKTCPLSFAQERIWIEQSKDPGTLAYNRPAVLTLQGPLQVECLHRAWREWVLRHAVLGAAVGIFDDLPFLDLSVRPVPVLASMDFSGDPDPAARAAAELSSDARIPFDVESGPLVRGRLLHLAPGNHRLILVFHHLVFDGTSESVLLQELTELYAGLVEGRAPGLKPLEVEYSDFAAWDRSEARMAALSEGRAYWSRQLMAPSLAEPSAERNDGGGFLHASDAQDFTLAPALVGRLREFVRSENATLSAVFLAAVSVLLHRRGQGSDLIIGCPTAGRTRLELEPLVGVFINMLPIRVRLDPEDSGAALVRRVNRTLLEALRHQEVPLQGMVADLRARGEVGGSPLFRVHCVHERTSGPPREAGGVTFAVLDVAPGVPAADLTLETFESPDGIFGRWKCRGEAWIAGSFADLGREFAALLERLVANPAEAILRRPDRPCSEDPELDREQRHRMLIEWNNTAAPFRRDLCLHQLFELQAARVPDAVAVMVEGAALTYSQLDRRASRVAAHLRCLGVRPGALVGLCLDRSHGLLVGILGILKAGGAYVPLDPSHPAVRLTMIVEDAGLDLILTEPALAPHLPGTGVRLVFLEQAEAEAGDERVDSGLVGPGGAGTAPSPEGRAYVFFTSGSTGKPKGVPIRHRSVVSLLTAFQQMLPMEPGVRFLGVSSPGFDISVMEYFLPLSQGATTMLVSADTARDAGELMETMRRTAPRIMQATPATWTALLESGWTGNPAMTAVSGGEALQGPLRTRLARACGEVWDAYGPTETTIYSTVQKVSDDPPGAPVSCIGRPIANTRVYVLDPNRDPVPVGTPGELYIGGVGVSEGYLNRPDLTADRFVPDRFSDEPESRLYRTGDQCRWRPDGTLEFLGRLDHQVKLRGFRIELGEIEAALREHTAVSEAAVLLREDRAGDPRLVGYVVAAGRQSLDVAVLSRHLSARLPGYMVPSAFVVLPAMPLSVSGKIHRQALPAPEAHRPSPASASETARTPLEAELVALWEEVLGVRGIVGQDNFFALGGNSLLAQRLIAAVHRRFDRGQRLSNFLQDPTVAGMAAWLGGTRDPAGATAIPRTTRPGVDGVPATGPQADLWITAQIIPDPGAYLVAYASRMTGPLDPARLEQALRTVVERQDILRTQFRLVGQELMQEVVPWNGPWIEWEDLGRVAPADRESAVAAGLAEATRVPMDLGAVPLWRFRVLRLDALTHVVVFTVHHVLVDEWSMHLLFSELEVAYRIAAGESASLPELPIRFADYALWQRAGLDAAELASNAAYWRRCLAGYSGAMELPADRPAPMRRTGRSGRCLGSVPAEVRAALQRLAREEGVSEFVVGLAAWQAWLAVRTGQSDILVGTPVAQRERPEVEFLAGLFLQTVPIRTMVDPEQGFRSLLRAAWVRVSEALAHAALPLVEMMAGIPRAPDALSVFPAAFVLLPRRWPELRLPGIASRPVPIPAGAAKFDLLLLLTPDSGAGGWEAELEYSAERFSPERARELLDGHLEFLSAVAGRPDAPLSTVRATTAPACNLMDLLENDPGARSDPMAIEWGWGSGSMSRATLRQRYDHLASVLAGRGVGPGVAVALCVGRSAERIIGVLGILKAGGACLPVDPKYPPERIVAMLEDGRPDWVVCHRVQVPLFAGSRVPILVIEDLDSLPAGPVIERCPAGPEDPVYVLFTSGSTGRAKGVTMPHRALVNLIRWQCRTSILKPGERTLQFAPISFDVSFQEIFATLVSGGTLVLVTEEDRLDPAALLATIQTGRVNRLILPFVALQALAEAALRTGPFPHALREVFCSGEPLRITPEITAFFERLPHCRFCNQYGPTEGHVVSEFGLSGPPATWERMPPIGRAIDGVRLRVLDDRLNPVAAGVEGELYLGGACLATGYRNRPDLTAERFVSDPRTPGERWYRTGDRVVERADGVLEFRGRTDGQVKVRGHRVELGEIEAALERFPAIGPAAAVGVADASGMSRLVAFYESARPVEEGVLRRHLSGILPEYMVPSTLLPIDRLPRTSSGKLDRRALEVLAQAKTPGAGESSESMTEDERTVAAIWSEVLNRREVGLHGDFFELGGHSLLAMRVIARLRRAWSGPVPIRALFDHPTVAQLAAQRFRWDHSRPSGASSPPSDG